MARPRNRARGEVKVTIGGRSANVAMTLGALAQMEDALGIKDFGELGEKFSNPTPKTILDLMRCILAGNGVEFEEAELLKLQLPDVITALNELIAQSSFADGDDEAAGGDGAEAQKGNGQAQMPL